MKRFATRLKESMPNIYEDVPNIWSYQDRENYLLDAKVYDRNFNVVYKKEKAPANKALNDLKRFVDKK